MLKTERHTLAETKQDRLRRIYNRHGSKLFGYIFEVVKDQRIAEEYLVKVFQDIALQPDERNIEAAESWTFLQRFAKNRLAIFVSAMKACNTDENPALQQFSRNKYLDDLNDYQRKVFCDVYYHSRTIQEIASELNETEELTRKTLKEAFAIMRRSSGN